MALAKQITLTNTDVSNVYIDAGNIEAVKRAVKTDLKNIINDIDNIKKAYNTLANDKNTKGSYKTTATKCVNKCKTYHKNLASVRTSLENKIDDAVIKYVLSMLSELQKAESAADSINTTAE